MPRIRPPIQQNPSRRVTLKQREPKDWETCFALTSSTELQKLNEFYYTLGTRLLDPPVLGLHKEVHDAIMANLFPDILNNPISRKRNLEFIRFIFIEAIKEQILLEFLFTQQQLKLIATSLKAYVSALAQKAASHQHRYLELVGNPPKKMELQRVIILEEMLRLQASMYNLRLETQKIYGVMGKTFKKIFDEKINNFLHPDTHPTITAVTPEGSIEIEQHDLVFHIRDFIANAITRIDNPPLDLAMILSHEVDCGALDYIIKKKPELKSQVTQVSELPELIPVLDKFNQFIRESYLLNRTLRSLFMQTIQINKIYREQGAQLQRLAKHPSMHLNEPVVFFLDRALLESNEEGYSRLFKP